MKFIIDLDNTLVFSNDANNSAYNRALELEGINPIIPKGRITRDVVQNMYPGLTHEQLNRIIANKKRLYPIHETRLNHDLVEYVRKLGKNSCLLWSSADRERAISIMDYHGLIDLFFDIYISSKTDIVKELEAMSNHFAIPYHELVIFEDTDKYILDLRRKGIHVVDIKYWKP